MKAIAITEQQINDIVAVFERHATRWTKIIIGFAIAYFLTMFLTGHCAP